MVPLGKAFNWQNISVFTNLNGVVVIGKEQKIHSRSQVGGSGKNIPKNPLPSYSHVLLTEPSKAKPLLQVNVAVVENK